MQNERKCNSTFWKYVKSKKEDNIGVSPLKSGNHLVTDGKGKAEKLIDQFQSVFTKDDGDSIPPFPTRVNEHIPPLKITKKGVTKLLQNIKVSKAAGPDGLPNRVLQECASEISPALTTIFQNLNLNSLLVKRQIDNPSPGAVTGGN